MASSLERPAPIPSMQRLLFVVIGCVAALLLLVGCTAAAISPGAPGVSGGGESAGFWLGLWQGFIAPLVFLVSLFNHSLGIYEVNNVGSWYNFGYLVGLSAFFSGGGASARRRPQRRPNPASRP